MKVAVFSTKPYDRRFLEQANAAPGHEISFFEPRLTRETVSLAAGFEAVCCFVNDDLDAGVLLSLQRHGTRLIVLRSAGYNNVDLAAAGDLGLTVARVPAYSPHAVAEHTLALMLALDRKLHRAYNRVREGNFSLEGLLGRELHTRTVGIVGTGKIGAVVARILSGFGARLLAYDPHVSPEVIAAGGVYVDLDRLLVESDFVTLHCPLLPQTFHIINHGTLARMKDGVQLINTSRGALIDTPAVIAALKSGKLGGLGIDVYEEEETIFFEDLSGKVLYDDVFARLLTFPNVIVTGHQAFFTEPALAAIAATTIDNITKFSAQQRPEYEVVLAPEAPRPLP